MCNRYRIPDPAEIASYFQVPVPTRVFRPVIGPRNDGPYVAAGQARVGQWSLIPDGNASRVPIGWNGKPISTNNCRAEGMRAKSPTFKRPWARGQRCLIPAASFDEPYWGSDSGKNIWWKFWRADGAPWSLAGLWNDWTDPVSGEVCHSYTMITVNSDSHPLMRRMHKPAQKLGVNCSVCHWVRFARTDGNASLKMPGSWLLLRRTVDFR